MVFASRDINKGIELVRFTHTSPEYSDLGILGYNGQGKLLNEEEDINLADMDLFKWNLNFDEVI